jgi:molecular chaperone Hsp33
VSPAGLRVPEPAGPSGPESDRLHRFLFESTQVRGELVSLDASWRAVLGLADYPPAVGAQLGQALSAVTLLSATIKFQGSLILQAQGSGPLRTLVAQATHERQLRGLARWGGRVPDSGLPQVFGEGHLVMTVAPRRGKRYQGIVALQGGCLADALHTYFTRSEQLGTRLWLAADAGRACGLLLQALPGPEGGREDWERISMLGATLVPEELLSLAPRELLYRLFHQERVRLLDPEPVSFRCTCSRRRVGDTLRALGRAEIDAVLRERGTVEVDCEFCNRHYSFDPVDVELLFASEPPPPAPPGWH